MPSEANLSAAERGLAASRSEFHSALASTFEELRGLVRSNKGDLDPQVDGAFTKGYMDLERFHALAPHGREDACDWPRLEAAMAVLGELAAMGDDLFHVSVAPGKGLRCTVNKALARIGRAFSAARSASLAQAGLPGTEAETQNLAAWPFARWSKAERDLAPGLVVEVTGEALCAEQLIEFLDGGLQIVLLVHGPAGPAPLAGLVRPGFHVAQYSSAPEVLGLPAGKPAVVGLFPDAGEATARFVHRPAPPEVTGQGTWSRLELEALPPEPPKAGLGGRSAQQLTEELRLLAALAIEPAGSTPGAAAPAEAAPEGEASRAAREGAEASADPVDRLAAWLLSKRQA